MWKVSMYIPEPCSLHKSQGRHNLRSSARASLRVFRFYAWTHSARPSPGERRNEMWSWKGEKYGSSLWKRHVIIATITISEIVTVLQYELKAGLHSGF